ncbi:uncharacterized [Tachysurus ichikawai]
MGASQGKQSGSEGSLVTGVPYFLDGGFNVLGVTELVACGAADQSSLLQLPFRNGSCIRSALAFRNPLRGKRAFQLISLMTGGD